MRLYGLYTLSLRSVTVPAVSRSLSTGLDDSYEARNSMWRIMELLTWSVGVWGWVDWLGSRSNRLGYRLMYQIDEWRA